MLTLRAVAEYQMMGGDDPKQIMTDNLDAAVRAGVLLAFEITAVHPSTWGVDLVMFTADLSVTEDLRKRDGREATHYVRELLNDVIGDTDVDVRWLYTTDGPGCRYKHHAPSQTFLGRWKEYDLWHCPPVGGRSTVLARKSDQPEDFITGLANGDPALAVAQHRAQERGLLTDGDETFIFVESIRCSICGIPGGH